MKYTNKKATIAKTKYKYHLQYLRQARAEAQWIKWLSEYSEYSEFLAEHFKQYRRLENGEKR